MDNNQLIPYSHVFFLTTFLSPRQPNHLPIMSEDDWTRYLGEEPQVVTELLLKRDLIQQSSIRLHLETKFSAAELRNILQERDLPTYGTKKELVCRLVSKDRYGVNAALGSFTLLQCTEKGANLANSYLMQIIDIKDIAECKKLKLPMGKMRDFTLWFSAAAVGGVIGNNADRVSQQLWALLKKSMWHDVENKKPGESKPEKSERDMQSYYKVYQIPEVIFLRECFNHYIRNQPFYGLPIIDDLRNFPTTYYRSKFVVLQLTQHVGGGYNIYIMFQDRPDKIFTAWVYQIAKGDVDGKFEMRSFWEHEIDDEKLLRIRSDIKEFLEDREHSI